MDIAFSVFGAYCVHWLAFYLHSLCGLFVQQIVRIAKMSRNFMEMLGERWESGYFVCIGIDSEFTRIPVHAHRGGHESSLDIGNTLVNFNLRIVDRTKDVALAYKPNLAFYLWYGDEGVNALTRTIREIRLMAPGIPVILDAKFMDIGNTNMGYVHAAFSECRADAITINPYLGFEAARPFLEDPNKGAFVLCRTSNEGAGEFQDLMCGGEPLYMHVARNVRHHWNQNRNCGLVVGATAPEELAKVRRAVGDMPILIPGIGAQGGDVEATVKAGRNSRGEGMVINASRSIIFASKGADYAEVAGSEAKKLHLLINQYRNA